MVMAKDVDPQVRAQAPYGQGGPPVAHVEDTLLRDDHRMPRLAEGQEGPPEAAGHEFEEGHGRWQQGQLHPGGQHLLLLGDAEAAPRHLDLGGPARVRRGHEVLLEELLPVRQVIVDLEVLDAAPLGSGAVAGVRGLLAHAPALRGALHAVGHGTAEDLLHEVQRQGHRELEVRDLRLEGRPRPPLDEHVDVVRRRGEAQRIPCRQQCEEDRAGVRHEAHHGLEGRQDALVHGAHEAPVRAAAAAGRVLLVLCAFHRVGDPRNLAAEGGADADVLLHSPGLAVVLRALPGNVGR
mmetsp:Transcript_28822/g.91863  ORF Transcript_28822/g.91863 Transcript_28822/m.91863 type:complete len:294 (+) Transcript_28822:1140-2021(+)